VIDQLLKFYVKTHFCNGDEVKILGSWFRLHFIENEGMAYGMKLSESVVGKIALSVFRLVAVIAGFFILKWLVKKGYGNGVIVCGSLILAGALGNLLDSMFYGLIFSPSPDLCFAGNYDSFSAMHQFQSPSCVAKVMPFGHGYGKFLQGRVVDMLYFPLVDTKMPSWVPIWGGKNFVFFEPVFNFADAAISVGVITLVLFQKKLVHKKVAVAEN
jgi:signal peptidase II